MKLNNIGNFVLRKCFIKVVPLTLRESEQNG